MVVWDMALSSRARGKGLIHKYRPNRPTAVYAVFPAATAWLDRIHTEAGRLLPRRDPDQRSAAVLAIEAALTAPAYSRAAEEILRFKGQTSPSTQERSNNKRLVLNPRPIGVVAVIAPYDFPTDISSIAIAHALVAGNTVVRKPSDDAPRACAMVADLAAEVT
ncbi:hypothetical protein BN12_20025 [Nostocoides japonicum T1-X7]|uniref:Aldehyde dehydrogenase domain-containing protein n=1 Tax=Nostocoides japonicum T1-X7 TaxID=1194083 RepID=A0A077LX64_9MICO|nr:aldehyde dehydrogenase family protein [Tetrasphaera japonica]CCH77482.1 hypothetical protein BN12_20025 [Tetrasphaera japonica T1-X7]